MQHLKITKIILFAALCAFVAQAGTSYAAEPKKKAAAPAQKAAPAKQPTVPLNAITQAAFKAGVATCQARINQITNFVTGTAQHGALLFNSPTLPDKKQFSVSLEVNNQNSNIPSYVTTSFSPQADGNCSGSYEAVTYWVSPCADVAKNVFSVFKPSPRALHQQILVLGDSPTVRVFLIPAATGCISIKKEMLY